MISTESIEHASGRSPITARYRPISSRCCRRAGASRRSARAPLKRPRCPRLPYMDRPPPRRSISMLSRRRERACPTRRSTSSRVQGAGVHRRPPRRGVAAPPRPSTRPSASPRTRLSATFRGSALTGSPPSAPSSPPTARPPTTAPMAPTTAPTTPTSAPSSSTAWPSPQRRRAPLAPLAPPYPRLPTVATAAETALQRRASARRRLPETALPETALQRRASARRRQSSLSTCPVTCRGRAP